MTQKVIAGEIIDFTKFNKRGKIKILPPCEEKENGDWYCVIHDHFFPHDKEDSHCRIAWKCNEHGLEEA